MTPAEHTAGRALAADQSIAIVGAGIGGLTLALSLRHLGFRNVTVYDDGAGVAPASADHALEITANASRVLHALGLQDGLAGCALEPDFAYLRTWKSGFVLIQRPLGGFSRARYGAPLYLISNTRLRGLLRSACADLSVPLHVGQPVTEVDPEHGVLRFGDASEIRHAAVIAADGHESMLRRSVPAPAACRELPVRVISATTHLPGRESSIQTWLAEGRYCVQYPLPDDRVDLLAVGPAGQAADAPLDALRAGFAGCHKQLHALLERLEQADDHTAVEVPPARYWYAGRLALLGDACHPLPVFSAQGACAAIEDAWVLAVMMERWEDSPHEGFADYQRYRLPRVKKLKQEINRDVQQLLQSTGAQALKRNFQWSLASRFLPELTMSRLDWLYGYDCIKGFA